MGGCKSKRQPINKSTNKKHFRTVENDGCDDVPLLTDSPPRYSPTSNGCTSDSDSIDDEDVDVRALLKSNLADLMAFKQNVMAPLEKRAKQTRRLTDSEILALDLVMYSVRDQMTFILLDKHFADRGYVCTPRDCLKSDSMPAVLARVHANGGTKHLIHGHFHFDKTFDNFCQDLHLFNPDHTYKFVSMCTVGDKPFVRTVPKKWLSVEHVTSKNNELVFRPAVLDRTY